MDIELFTFERFAEDIFTLLWLQFDVPFHIIPRSSLKPNRYSSDDVLKSIVRSVSMYQIQNRSLFYETFEAEHIPANEDSYTEDMLFYLILQVTNRNCVFPPHIKPATIFAKTLQSLSVSAELALYVLSKGVKIDLKRIHVSWAEFFSLELINNFEADGGFKGLVEECYWSLYLDPFLTPFISRHCIPYVGADVYKKLIAFIANNGQMQCNDRQQTREKICDPASYGVYTHQRQCTSPKKLIQPGDIFESPPILESASASCPSTVSTPDTKEQKHEKLKKLLFHQRYKRLVKDKKDKQVELLTDKGSKLNPQAKNSVRDVISEKYQASVVTRGQSCIGLDKRRSSIGRHASALTEDAR